MSSLQFRAVRKSYGGVEVLKGLDFEVDEGDFLVLVGPSGCGKSTLLGLIAGFDEVTSGEILIGGRNLRGVHPSLRNIAMVFQSYALYPSMNVYRNMAFGLEMRKMARAEIDAKVRRVADTLQIEHLLDRRPGQLSGGQRQRVAMGRALVRDPQVFLFDEPLSNLDAKLRVEMRTEIKRLYQALGTTMVYVTHDQIEAMTLATKMAVLNGGELQQFGPPHEIYDRPGNVFVAEFMGSPAMNLLPARLTWREGCALAEIATASGAPFLLPLAGGSPPGPRDIRVGIRPAAFRISSDPGAEGTVWLRVDVIEPAGADDYVVLDWAGVEVTARLESSAGLSVGGMAPFTVRRSRLSFFDDKTGRRLDLLAAEEGGPGP